MSGLRTALLAAFTVGVLVEGVSAQPRGGIGERDRGVLGRVGARRDERLNRNAPPASANPNPNSANRLPNPNLPLNARAANPAAPNGRQPAVNPAAAQAGIAPNLQALGYPNTSPYANRNPNGNPNGSPTRAPLPQANMQASPRSAFYPETGTARNAPSTNPYSVAGSQSLLPTNGLPSAGVRPASASAPVNRLPYSGPGVLIRLPRTIPGEVNYLIDDSEHLIVHSGEDQLLRLKGSYEVRFSRGVTNDGRSYGEARYTITEGVYRFDVSASGWELYREGEAGDVEQAVANAQKRANEARGDERMLENESSFRADSSAALPPVRLPTDTPSSVNRSFELDASKDKATVPPPSPAPAEETLPAPKSILEPS